MYSFCSILMIAAMAAGQFGQQVFHRAASVCANGQCSQQAASVCANGQCSQQAAPQRIVHREVTRQSTPVVRQAVQQVAQVPARAVGAIQSRIVQSRQSGCSGQAVQASSGCAGSQSYVVHQPAPMPATCGNSPILQACQSEVVLSCSVQQTACQTHAQAAYGFTDPAYAVAHASATYRAQNGIKGHCNIERGHTAGVGFASNNPQPRTCFNDARGAYAVVQGRDGWYATKIVR